MFLHVFYSWVVANLLHPLVLLAYFHSEVEEFSIEIPGWGLLIFGVSVLLSLPALIAGWVVMHLINRLPFDSISKYFTWLFLACCLPLVIFITIVLFMTKELRMSELEAIVPATISVAAALIIRAGYFFKRLREPIETI